MAQADKVELGEIRPGLAEADKTAAAHVDQCARLAVNPNDVGRRGASIVGYGSARPEYLDGNPFARRTNGR